MSWLFLKTWSLQMFVSPIHPSEVDFYEPARGEACCCLSRWALWHRPAGQTWKFYSSPRGNSHVLIHSCCGLNTFVSANQQILLQSHTERKLMQNNAARNRLPAGLRNCVFHFTISTWQQERETSMNFIWFFFLGIFQGKFSPLERWTYLWSAGRRRWPRTWWRLGPASRCGRFHTGWERSSHTACGHSCRRLQETQQQQHNSGQSATTQMLLLVTAGW